MQIDYPHRLFLIGSCFTENIGEKLKKAKFPVLENPHGILFNPVSVAEAIDDYLQNRRFSESELFHYNEGWHSWKHHSRFSDPEASLALEKINRSVEAAHDYLGKADHLMITLGSAWTYQLTEKAAHGQAGTVVANNHKAPADWFSRRLLSPQEVVEMLARPLRLVQQMNPEIQLIFTISPVRHLREGVVENNRSKAVLIQAVHELVSCLPNAYYFPAYELVIDDLRDYRYYAEDLVHPNYFATQYVWEKFTDACFTQEAKLLMEQLHSIHLAFRHRAFNESSEQHRSFLKTNFEKTKQLIERYPYLDLQKELEYFAADSR